MRICSFVLLLLVFAASCSGSVYLRAPVVCQLTGATGLYVQKLPKDSPYTAELLSSVGSILSGGGNVADLNTRMVVVRYILEVTDGANTFSGVIRDVQGPDGVHFWAPTAYFTFDPRSNSYSVAGLNFPLFTLGRGDSNFRPVKVDYEQFRTSALIWMDRELRK